jgi:hypothetical protein
MPFSFPNAEKEFGRQFLRIFACRKGGERKIFFGSCRENFWNEFD